MARNGERFELAQQVATELGLGWSAEDPGQDYPGAYLNGPDQARLYLRGVWNDAGRVEISGGYPQNAQRPQHYSIKVTAARGPAAIAREVTRRLLPDYLPALAEVIAGEDDDRQAAKRRAEAAEELARLIPAARVDHHDRTGSYDTTVRVVRRGQRARLRRGAAVLRRPGRERGRDPLHLRRDRRAGPPRAGRQLTRPKRRSGAVHGWGPC